MSEYERRRNAAIATRSLYKTPRWRQLRATVLQAQPVCRLCNAASSAIVDHVTPHRGDVAAFWRGPFQALCKPCHDGPKQHQERRGIVDAVGPDGWRIRN